MTEKFALKSGDPSMLAMSRNNLKNAELVGARIRKSCGFIDDVGEVEEVEVVVVVDEGGGEKGSRAVRR